jgi:transketolase
MISPQSKLAANIFESPEQSATRDGFGKALLELGQTNPNVVVVCADLAESTRVLATVASGLAAYGKIPFITSYAAFNPGRNNEQIRTTISLNQMPVKIAGMHAGVSVGPDGATHQALEDMALMRVQPNMTVISPCDAQEAYRATLAAAAHPGPVYIRCTREKTPTMTTADTPFVLGKLVPMWEAPSPQVAVFATGPLLYQALLAAKELDGKVAVTVHNVATIKPLDMAGIVAAAQAAGAVVTVEEHQLAGGMGSAVAEVLAAQCPVPMEFVAVHDQFGQSGTPAQLIEHYGLGAPAIVAAIVRAQARKAT